MEKYIRGKRAYVQFGLEYVFGVYLSLENRAIFVVFYKNPLYKDRIYDARAGYSADFPNQTITENMGCRKNGPFFAVEKNHG